MPFVKGKSGNPKGKPAGAVAIFTRSIKDVILEAFHEAQKNPKTSFLTFLRNNPRDGYTICAKLLPMDVRAELSIPDGIKVIFANDPDSKPIGTNPEDNFGVQGQQTGL